MMKIQCARLTCGQLLKRDELDFERARLMGMVPTCPHCGGSVIEVPMPLWIRVVLGVLFVLSALSVALAIAALNGCAGAPFTAGEAVALESAGGAGGTQNPTNQGGAAIASSGGGQSVQSNSGSALESAGGAGGTQNPTNQGGAAIASSGGGQSVQSNSGSSAMGDAGAAPVALCELAGATATAFASWTSGDGGPPSSAVDGSSSTRWASGVPQAPGQWFEVTLAAPLELERLVLVSRASDVPAAVALELDGVAVPATLSSAPGQIALDFAPHRTTTIRLELEQASASWWSIDELAPGCP